MIILVLENELKLKEMTVNYFEFDINSRTKSIHVIPVN